MKKTILFLIRLYQKLFSPFIGHCCRFFPSCSDYGVAAIERHGWRKGGYLTVKRVLKCHPFHSGGVDFPPEESEEASQGTNPLVQLNKRQRE